MTTDERSHITNGIWLCTTHADLIDGDAVTYTADVLKAMKKDHEGKIKIIQRDRLAAGAAELDLISVGDSIFTGEIVSIERDHWTVRVGQFVEGDVSSLIEFIGRFDRVDLFDRGILINALGDGRVLHSSPTLSTEGGGGYVIRCPISSKSFRTNAKMLPGDLALGPNNDLAVKNGDLAMVSGIEALSQKIKTVLSMQRGESPFHPSFGARFSEYYINYGDSPWFAQLLKLELIRQAAIPYYDPVQSRSYTPLHCVDRVVFVEALADTPDKNWLPIRVGLNINGISTLWVNELSIYITANAIRRPSIAELFAGPGVMSSE